jgi:hypothetical protein
MRQIAYNNAAFTIPFEYPSEWDVASITGVNVSIDSNAGTALVASTAATIYTATTLYSSVAVGDAFVVLAVGASAPQPGRQYKISASSAGPAELITCHHYDSSLRYLYTNNDIRYAHSSGTAVKGCYCSYDLNTSTVATYTKGKQLVINWAPAGSDDLPVKEMARIDGSMFGGADFDRRFKQLYPREYQMALDRDGNIDWLVEESREQLNQTLTSRGLDIDRVVDQNRLMPTTMNLARWLCLLDGGDEWETERKVALDEYVRSLELLCASPIWQDTDQDKVQDDTEVDEHGPLSFSWGRNL